MSDDRPRVVLCSGCGQLVGVNDAECLNCGRRRPGRRGVGAWVAGALDMDTFVMIVTWTCLALYLSTLAADWNGVAPEAGFDILSPSLRAAYLFGASGAVPVLQFGRWWTLLSASWLHGGLLHIAFNLLWIRDLLPLVGRLLGASRAVILYVVSGVTGFLTSTVAGVVIGPMPIIGAGTFTLGASACIFGMLGALLALGRRGGDVILRTQARLWILGGVVMGFIIPGIDNWAHFGGFAGGYLCALVLNPLKPERPGHAMAALACLLASWAAVLYSVVTALPQLR
jgi:rhomboid protease GluP